MGSNRNWLLPMLLSLAWLAGCASQPRAPVTAPCPEIPPLPTAIAAPPEFPAALSRLNGLLTTFSLPPLVIQPGSPPASSPTSESAPREIDGLPIVEPDMRRPRSPNPWDGMNARPRKVANSPSVPLQQF